MTWSKALVAVASLAMVAGVVPASGGDSQYSPADFDSGLPPDKALDSLTRADAQQACVRFTNVFNDRFPEEAFYQKFCTRLGASLGTSEDACDDYVETCLETPSEQPDPDNCATAEASAFAGCELTVADLEACSGDLLGFIDDVLNRYSCSDAGDVPLSPGEQPASCTRLEDECPGAMIGLDPLPE